MRPEPSAPPGVPASTWNDALWRFWTHQLEAVSQDGKRPDWRKRRIAAIEVCRMCGLAELVRAVAADGELRPPPAWPEVDCVPVGGGPGLVLCEVRTMHDGRKHSVRIGLVRNAGARKLAEAFDRGQIAEAIERGRFELRKRLSR